MRLFLPSIAMVIALASGWTAEAQPLVNGTVQKLNLIVRSEITIDRPVKAVWPAFLNMGAWMTHDKFETVKGVPGEEGEVQRVTSPEAGVEDKGYLIETVRVTPMQQYAVKVAARDQPFFGFGDFTFIGAGGKTRVLYSIFVEFIVPAVSEEELRKQRAQYYKNSYDRLAENLRNLKALAEAK